MKSWQVALLIVPVALVLAAPGLARISGDAGEDASSESRNLRMLANSRTVTTGSDLAFWGSLAFVGKFGGFRIIDISRPRRPRQLADVDCEGPQGDVSVWGRLVFVSVDQPRSSPACAGGAAAATDPNAWEGIRIFDVSRPTAPRLITGVRTDCGSHTHTLLPDLDNRRVLLYVASGGPFPQEHGPNCPEDNNLISIVEVPLETPAAARVLKEQPLRPDTGFFTPPPESGLVRFRACHDITVFPAIKLAAAACYSEGQIWDISDPANPGTLDAIRIRNDSLSSFHSAAFTWDGKVIAFGDEVAGGGAAACGRADRDRGAIWLYRVTGGAPLGHFKLPRPQIGTCTAHNYNFVPTTNARYILVSSWYTGGTSVADLTNPTKPQQLAFAEPPGANAWSSYWYNGLVFVNGGTRGLDVFALTGPARTRAAARPFQHLNPQTQEFVIP